MRQRPARVTPAPGVVASKRSRAAPAVNSCRQLTLKRGSPARLRHYRLVPPAVGNRRIGVHAGLADLADRRRPVGSWRRVGDDYLNGNGERLPDRDPLGELRIAPGVVLESVIDSTINLGRYRARPGEIGSRVPDRSIVRHVSRPACPSFFRRPGSGGATSDRVSWSRQFSSRLRLRFCRRSWRRLRVSCRPLLCFRRRSCFPSFLRPSRAEF